MFRIPDALQHEVLLRGAQTVADAAFAAIPGLQRTVSRCAAPGKRGSCFNKGRG
jgi:hypothetical protein